MANPIGFIYLHKVYSKHLEYFLVLASQPCPIWAVLRDPILGVPSMYFVRSSYSCFTAQIYRRSLILSSGICHFPLIWRFFRALACPFFYCYCDSLKFSYGLPCDWKRCPKNYCPCLMLLLSHDEKGIMGFSYLLSDELTLMAVFPQIMRLNRG